MKPLNTADLTDFRFFFQKVWEMGKDAEGMVRQTSCPGGKLDRRDWEVASDPYSLVA